VVLEAGRARTEDDNREHVPAYELKYRGRTTAPLAGSMGIKPIIRRPIPARRMYLLIRAGWAG